MNVNECINYIKLDKFEVKAKSDYNKSTKGFINERRNIRFLTYIFYLLISSYNESNFNFIKITIFKILINIDLYIIENLFTFNT